MVTELICAALHPYPEDLMLVTEVGQRAWVAAPGTLQPAQRCGVEGLAEPEGGTKSPESLPATGDRFYKWQRRPSISRRY